MGKLGKVKLDADGSGAMAEPFVYDASNIDKFSKSSNPPYPTLSPQGERTNHSRSLGRVKVI